MGNHGGQFARPRPGFAEQRVADLEAVVVQLRAAVTAELPSRSGSCTPTELEVVSSKAMFDSEGANDIQTISPSVMFWQKNRDKSDAESETGGEDSSSTAGSDAFWGSLILSQSSDQSELSALDSAPSHYAVPCPMPHEYYV